MPWLLNLRLRAAVLLLAVVPTILLRPIRGRGVEVFLSPFGAILAGVLLLAGAQFIEERGGASSIRLAAATRFAATTLAVSAFGFAYHTACFVRFERVESWTLFVLVAMIAHVLYGVITDAGVAIEPRFMQSVRLASLDADAITLRTRGRDVIIPLNAVREAHVEHRREVWWASVILTSRERIHGDAELLPWHRRDATSTTLRLTEYQLGMNASDFCTRIADHAERSGRYR